MNFLFPIGYYDTTTSSNCQSAGFFCFILRLWQRLSLQRDFLAKALAKKPAAKVNYEEKIVYKFKKTSVYKGYKQDKIEMRGDRAEMSDFPLYLNTVAGGLDRRDQTIGGFSFVVKIYAVPVVEIIG